MSATNGTAGQPPLSYREVREQLRIARAQAEIRRLQIETQLLGQALPRLQESFLPSYTGVGFGELVDPMDAYRDADQLRAFPIGARNDRQDGRNRPFVFTDLDLDLARGLGRWLTTRNGLAIGAVSTIRDYTIKTGYTYEAQPARRYATDRIARALAEQVQDVIDEFSDLNAMPRRERSACWRAVRDGEVFWRHFDQRDGRTLVRFIEPEQIRQPLGSPPHWLFGIETDPDDIEMPLTYAVSYGNPEDWEPVPAGDVCHLKRNVDECVKRGLSDFFSTGDALDGTWKMLRNMVATGGVQAAIAWIEQFSQATQASVQSHVQAVRDQGRTYYPQAITGREVNYQRFEPGTVVKTGPGREYKPAPLAANTTQHIGIVQAALRSIGARWRMPEYMISGDASNANFASTLVAGSPFVNAVEGEQPDFGDFFLRSRWIAVRNAARAGRFHVGGRVFSEREVQEYVDIHVTPPAVAIANKAEEAAIDHADMDRGVMSVQTRRAKLGLDDAKERQGLQEEPLRSPGGGGGLEGGPAPWPGGPPGFFPRRPPA
jgi:hypothetical protein